MNCTKTEKVASFYPGKFLPAESVEFFTRVNFSTPLRATGEVAIKVVRDGYHNYGKGSYDSTDDKNDSYGESITHFSS
jgi:hypothetical protein